MFMNEEKIELKDLPRADAHTVLDAFLDGRCETLNGDKWFSTELGSMRANGIYRVQPRPMQVPWDALEDWVQWVTIYSAGDKAGYTEMPVPRVSDDGGGCFILPAGPTKSGKPSKCCGLNGVKIIAGDGPWYEQIQQRPAK